MPFSAGTYTLPTNSFAEPVSGQTISSTDATSTWSDFTTAFNTCYLRDGTATATGNFPMGNFKLTGLGAGTVAGNSLRYEQVFTTGPVAFLGAINEVQATTIAAATTLGIGAIGGNYVQVSGASTIASFDVATAGIRRILEFAGANTLTNSSNLILPGTGNITTAAGDVGEFLSEGAGNWRCANYGPASGMPVQNSRFKIVSFTYDVSTASGTQAITGVGFQPKLVRFDAAMSTPGTRVCMGTDDGVTPSCIYGNAAGVGGDFGANNSSLFLDSGGGATASGVISTFGSDGFTITWTKAGSPTGTVTIKATCSR